MYDDDRDALAAEYVLGTLSADERDQAEALLVIDPGFAEIVRVWERRLGELNVMVEAVEPPPEVWDRIKTEIDGNGRRPATQTKTTTRAIEETAPPTATETLAQITPEPATEALPELQAEPILNLGAAAPQDESDDTSAVAELAASLLPPESPPEAEQPSPAEPPARAAPKIERSADVIYLARQAKRWRGLTVAMSAIAALLAVYVALGQFAPNLLSAGRTSPSAETAPAPQSRLVAVLQQEPTAPAFLLTVDPQSRTMTVRRMTASPETGRSYELWLIPGKDSKPRSLGLVGAEEFTTRPLPGDFDAAQLQAGSYAVSLEPAGGSPSGAPTGPILFTGKMVESVPAAAPTKT